MLLSCCFRDPKGKKCKSRKEGASPTGTQKQGLSKSSDSQCLLPSPRDPPPQIQASVHTHLDTLSSSPRHVPLLSSSPRQVSTLSSSPRHVATFSSSPRHVATVYTSTPNPRQQQAWTGEDTQRTAAPLDLKLVQKERYPLTKEAKRLQKQRSQDSVSRILAEGTANHRVSIPYIDQSPIDPALPRPPSVPRDTPPLLRPLHALHHLHAQDLPSPPPPPLENSHSPPPPLETHLSSPPLDIAGLVPRQHGRRGPKMTACSVPNLSQQQLKRSSLINDQSEKSVSVGQVEKLTSPTLQTDQKNLSSPSRSQVSSPSHSETIESFSNSQDEHEGEKEVFVSKMMRSTASYGIKDLLQEQINMEEEEVALKKQREHEESIIRRVKKEYEDLLGRKNIENERMLQNVQSHYEAQMADRNETHQKELEKVVMKSKNELNALIIQHGKELELAKQELETVKSYADSQRDMEMMEKEAEWSSIKHELEQRDRLWQEEKLEVLAEVQRLKAEAGRMVAILAMEVEEEEEMLSEERKRTLQQEVESLKMVVEMKSADFKQLKGRQDEMEKQLEEMDVTKNELIKMRAKVEDLQDQLDQKSEKEKELSMEKSKLEAWMEAESRSSARKSLEVEQLQWRIRHNMDLPPVFLHQPMSCPPQDLSPEGVAQWNSGAKERPQSAPTSTRIHEDHEIHDASMNGPGDAKDLADYRNGIAIIDEDTLEDISQSCLSHIGSSDSQDNRCEIIYDNMSTVRESVSHFEKMISSESHKCSIIDAEERSMEEKHDAVSNKHDDTFESDQVFNGVVDDASDEGLGDISSENDSGSPQPNEDSKEEKNLEIVKCAKNFDKTQQFLDLSAENEIINSHKQQAERKMSSPADERLPSRMPFETPL